MDKYLKQIFRYFVGCIKFVSIIAFFLLIGEASSSYYEHRKYLREGTSRILFYQVPFLEHRLRPYYAADYESGLTVINRFGFRGSDFSIKKPDNTYRIICIGESTTFGLGGTDNNHTYPVILEAKLNNESNKRNGVTFEVINAGVPSYTSTQCFILMGLELISFQPDMFIIYTGWNEMGNSICEGWNADYRYGFRFSDFTEQRKNFLEFSNIYKSFFLKRLQNTAYKIRRFIKIPEPKDNLPEFKKEASFNKNSLSIWENNIRNMISLAKDNGVKVILLTWPQIYNLTDDHYPLEEVRKKFPKELATLKDSNFYKKWMASYKIYQQRLRKIAVDTNVYLCDMADIFVKENNPSLFYDEFHLTGAGNELFAKTLRNFIQE